ncbi:hypothetical protein GCM10022286_00420 [Gryllotalpicola daejeonensis]|uniref:Uncharacterized protein n=1 Tax=Gryllotalpicola daejeonensis TaxID=993087 RepID=A0ABP7ZCN2_9MICO
MAARAHTRRLPNAHENTAPEVSLSDSPAASATTPLAHPEPFADDREWARALLSTDPDLRQRGVDAYNAAFGLDWTHAQIMAAVRADARREERENRAAQRAQGPARGPRTRPRRRHAGVLGAFWDGFMDELARRRA